MQLSSLMQLLSSQIKKLLKAIDFLQNDPIHSQFFSPYSRHEVEDGERELITITTRVRKQTRTRVNLS